VVLVYLRPFFSDLFFLKLWSDLSFPGVRRWGGDCGCLLELEVAVVDEVFLAVEDEAFEGEVPAFARLRAADVVSVRSK
jgi:hypothetical protein